MYDEEKMIDGIMHFKTMPNSEFRPIGLKQLSLRYQELKSRLMEATTDLEEAVKDSEMTFICVGTPSEDDGSIYLDNIFKVSHEIGSALRDKQEKHYVIMKSTVLPGTTEKAIKIIEQVSDKRFPNEFSAAMNPEFLKEGSAVYDFFHQDRIVIGSSDLKAIEKVEQAYRGITKSIDKGLEKVIKTDFKNAELGKYANNAMLALKITFANEIGNVCKKAGADMNVIAEIIGADQRIGPYFLRSGIGYGGSCFPKDIAALRSYALREGYLPRLLIATEDVNKEQPMKLIELLDKKYNHELRGKNIAVLGLAFKSDTDDIRYSPALRIVKELLSRQVRLNLYDPAAMENVREIYPSNDRIRYTETAQEAVNLSNIVLLTTEWPEFKSLDFGNKPVFDGKNVFYSNPQRKPKNYEGVCW